MPARRRGSAKPSSSVVSSPTKTGRRPRNGGSARKAAMASPLSALRGWNSTTILPVIRRNTEAASRWSASTTMRISGSRCGAAHAIENSVGTPSFEPVQAGCGTLPRLEQLVELGQRATADQGKRSLALCRKPNDQRRQAVRYSNQFRTGSELDQCPVDIEEQSRLRIERQRARFGERQGGVFVRCT